MTTPTADSTGEPAAAETTSHEVSSHARSLEAAGTHEGVVNVRIGPRFLELFSANLYASPNKAFEELVSNSWDAGATVVHVQIPEDLTVTTAGMWVLDNGESMDLAGLEQLWDLASSAKRERTTPPRPPIGKFGIGKLATYILAHEVTYVCQASDGLIRAVTMDYHRVDAQPTDASPKLQLGELQLEVRRLDAEALQDLFADLPDGDRLLDLINQGVPPPTGITDVDDGFGGAPAEELAPKTETWTLALLTNLKDDGRRVKSHFIRRMLRAALPLGASISIGVNGEAVESTKLDLPVAREWRLGPGLDLRFVDDENDSPVEVIQHENPHPHVTVAGIPGPITGTARLYEDRISGGKSDDRARSVGFFVNVRGRIISLDDPYFGLENLSHGAWAHFRCTIRADGLDEVLNIERDTLRDGPELRLFRSLLRELFNLARNAYSARTYDAWPTAGDLLVRRWDAFPLKDLGDLVGDRLGSSVALPMFVDASDIDDAEAERSKWRQTAKERPSELLSDVREVEADPDAALASYKLSSRQLELNANHPFAREHGVTAEERELVRDLALLDFLVETHMVQAGVDVHHVDEMRQYRDRVMRVLARLRRRTGAQIAQLLEEATGSVKGLEIIVGEALEYLGFVVTPIGGNGQPEGVARAPITPNKDEAKQSYSFTYEAKSTNHSNGKVPADDVNPGKLLKHREKHAADFTLVVAPDFQEGDISVECEAQGVTPMRARDLATLLILSGRKGAVPLEAFRSLFTLHDPDQVHGWVENLFPLSDTTPSRLRLEEILDAVESIGDGPDVLKTNTVALEIRRARESNDRPTNPEVRAVVQGFGVLLPGLIESSGDDLYLSGSVDVIRQRIREMLERLPESLQAKFNQ